MTNKRESTSAPDIDAFDLDDFFEGGGDEWDDEFQALGVENMDITGSSAAVPAEAAEPPVPVPPSVPPPVEDHEDAAVDVDLTGTPEIDSMTIGGDLGGAGSDAGSWSDQVAASSAANTRSKQASGATKQDNKSKASQRQNKSKKKKQQQQQQQQQQQIPPEGRTSPRLRGMAVSSSPGGEIDKPKVTRAVTTTRGEKSKESSSKKKSSAASGQSARSKSTPMKKKGSVSAPQLPTSSNQSNLKPDVQSSVGSAGPSTGGSRAVSVATRGQPANQQQTQRSKGTTIKASSSSKSSPAPGSSAPDEVAPTATTSKRGLGQDRRQRQMRLPQTAFASSSSDLPANAAPLSAAPMLGTPTTVGGGGIGRNEVFGQAPPASVVSTIDLSTDATMKFPQGTGQEPSALTDKDGQASTVAKSGHLGSFDIEESSASGGNETMPRRMSGSRPGSSAMAEGLSSFTTFFPFSGTPSDVYGPRNNTKTYRLLEKLNAITGQGSDSLDLASPMMDEGSTPSNLASDAAVYRLMSHYVKVPSPTVTVSGAPDGCDGPSLSRSLSSAKDLVSRNRASVGREVLEALTLVNRQSNFLMLSMNKMKRWCQENYGADDEGATSSGMTFPITDICSQSALRADVVASTLSQQLPPSSSDLAGNKTKLIEFWRTGAARAKSSVGSVGSAGTTKLRVKVKVKCAGFKDQALSGRTPIFAEFSSSVVLLPVAKGLSEASSTMDQSDAVPDASVSATIVPSAPQVKSSKMAVSDDVESMVGTKRKHLEGVKSTADNTGLAAPATEAPADLAFEELSVLERRMLLTKAWQRKGQKLAKKRKVIVDTKIQEQRKRDREIARLVNEDEIKISNTGTFWKVVEQTRYLSELTGEEMAAELGEIWQPEWAEEEETYFGEVGPPCVKARMSLDGEKESQSSSSLHDRLQSLLVEEESDDEESSRNGSDGRNLDCIVSEYADAFPGFCGADKGSNVVDADEALIDVSELCTSERAYIHLRAANLVDRRYNSAFVPRVLIEEEAEGAENDDAPNNVNNVGSRDKTLEGESKDVRTVKAMDLENDVEDTLAIMNAELLDLHRSVNWRVALLQEMSVAELALSKQRGTRDDDCKKLVSQHNQLLRKQETKRVSKKNGNRDWPNTFAVQST